MTDLSPGVIPYVEAHSGPRRVVTVTLQPPAAPLRMLPDAVMQPSLFVDGRQFIVYWGTVSFEAPADRPVHVAVGIQDGVRGASQLLAVGAGPVSLHYSAPAMGPAKLDVLP